MRVFPGPAARMQRGTWNLVWRSSVLMPRLALDAVVCMISRLEILFAAWKDEARFDSSTASVPSEPLPSACSPSSDEEW